jgi:hypothetical protein
MAAKTKPCVTDLEIKLRKTPLTARSFEAVYGEFAVEVLKDMASRQDFLRRIMAPSGDGDGGVIRAVSHTCCKVNGKPVLYFC